MNFKFDYIVDLPVTIEVEGFIPERPAPPCTNPSSPLYSDCGDPAEFSDFRVFFGNKDITGIIPERIIEEIIEQIYIEGENEVSSM